MTEYELTTCPRCGKKCKHQFCSWCGRQQYIGPAVSVTEPAMFGDTISTPEKPDEPFSVILPVGLVRLAAIVMRTVANDMRGGVSPADDIVVAALLNDAEVIDKALADPSSWIGIDGERMARPDLESCCHKFDRCARPCNERQEHFERLAGEAEQAKSKPAPLEQWVMAFGYLTTLMPCLEIDVCDPQDMARKMFDYIRPWMPDSEAAPEEHLRTHDGREMTAIIGNGK